MKLLVINGPNLNLLGVREPDIYGKQNYDALCDFIRAAAAEVNAECELYQSNHEGAIVDKIQDALGKFDGIVINPAAYTHTSIAIHDALEAAAIPAVEVHMSNIQARDDFRRTSLTAPACIAQIAGLGADGYEFALRALVRRLSASGQTR